MSVDIKMTPNILKGEKGCSNFSGISMTTTARRKVDAYPE
jgi:hypothetical protein